MPRLPNLTDRDSAPESLRDAFDQVAALRNGTVSIAPWKDDKTAAVTIFSSDGMIRSIKSQWTPQNPDVPYDGFHRLGKDYSIPFTFAGMPSLFRLKSITRYNLRCPPPRRFAVIRPLLFRPPFREMETNRLFSGVVLVTSWKSEMV